MIFLLIWQPPAFPYRHQYSIIGRFRLNHRVRDVDGCFPKAHCHQKYPELYCPKQSARFRSASSRCAASPHLRFQTQSLVSKLTVFSFVRYIASHYYHINNSTVKNSLLDFLRKEVIQPHLPIRLPCYDFTPVIEPAFDSSFLSVRSLASGIPNSHGVTGGVYKTRERIHRSILICDY